MDIRQFIFPFIMAVLTNSLMIVAAYFLRKNKYLAAVFGVWFMGALYLFCILRILVPIEFPHAQVIIMDKVVYTAVVDFFKGRTVIDASVSHLILYLLLALWFVGIAVSALITVVIQEQYKTYIKANYDFTTDEERALFAGYVHKILGKDLPITLKRTDAVDGPLVMGFFKKTVVLPEVAYSPEELGMVFRHELTHIRNKDLWLKLLIQIYCCIFWWNPFSYLLKANLGFSLELKCDLNVVGDLDDRATGCYIDTIKNSLLIKKRRKTPFLVCAELSDKTKEREMLKRFRMIDYKTADETPSDRKKQYVLSAVVGAALLAVFVASYIFIWQPYSGYEYFPEEAYYEDGVSEFADDSNAYLVKQDDGSYLFYFLETDPIPVTNEEVKEGLYDGYPIYEE